jgi:hypothetical protein
VTATASRIGCAKGRDTRHAKSTQSGDHVMEHSEIHTWDGNYKGYPHQAKRTMRDMTSRVPDLSFVTHTPLR